MVLPVRVGLLVVMGVAVNGAACEGGAASSNGCSC